MLEFGALKSSAEDRSHFSAWAITSSPLTLSFNLNDSATLDRVWPIITNRQLLRVNDAWAGSAGRRLQKTDKVQVWTKPLGNEEHALLVMAVGNEPVTASVSLEQIVTPQRLKAGGLQLCDVYKADCRQPHAWTAHADPSITDRIEPHDSRFYLISPRPGR